MKIGITACVALALGAGRGGKATASDAARAAGATPVHRAAALALPPPDTTGHVSLERALRARRSRREYGTGALSLAAVSQLLWAAQGVTGREGERTAPSAGALYPLEIYLVAGEVDGAAAGVYRYEPVAHRLVATADGDRRRALGGASFGQAQVLRAPAAIVITAVYARTAGKYGARGPAYVHMEAGSVAENVYLEAEALGLSTVQMGAFDDAAVQRALELPADHEPLAVMPVGRRR